MWAFDAAWTNEESGAYVRLLRYQWDNGGIPSDERKLAALLHTSLQRARAIWPTISGEFERCDDGLLRNPSLSGFMLNHAGKRGELSGRGRLGASARYGRSYDYSHSRSDSSSHGYGNGSLSGSESSFPSEGSSEDLLNPTLGRLASAGGVADSGFDEFWLAYPRKVGKFNARKAWRQMAKLRPPLAAILERLSVLRSSPQWTKDGGQYIPHPGTWLRRGGWDDEPEGMRAATRPAPQASRVHVESPAEDAEGRRRRIRGVD